MSRVSENLRILSLTRDLKKYSNLHYKMYVVNVNSVCGFRIQLHILCDSAGKEFYLI